MPAAWKPCGRCTSKAKLKHSITDYEQRLERELAIIQQMQFPGYFLIVWDFIRYANEHDIPVGPGRGSAAGSLVSYALGITDIDPLQHELLFERFLNPERVSMPDIDIDFCMNRRGEVIQYVTQKYGRDNVAQIITFGTMAAKAAIKDVGRAMDIPYADVDRIAKMVPTQLNITLEQAIRRLRRNCAKPSKKMAQIRELFETAQEAGRHGAQLRRACRRSRDFAAPAHRSRPAAPHQERRNRDRLRHGRDRQVGPVEDGLPRPDHADDSHRRVEADRADARRRPSRWNRFRWKTHETYEKVFYKGLTSGVFQFESHGMRDVLRKYQPNSIEDLTALNALYRPGPIQGGMIDDFIDRKHGRKKVEYELPELQEILQETLGVIVYQEQVMQIANRLAGYSLGEADLLRRAMGKKKAEEMAQQRERFVEGAAQAKVPPEEDRKDFRPHGPVRRIRLQQVALGRLCPARLSHGVSEDALSRRVHGSAADLGHRLDRRRGQVHQRMPGDGNRGRGPRHQRFRRELHAARRSRSASGWPQ